MTPQQTQALWAKFDEAAQKTDSADAANLIDALKAATEMISYRLQQISMSIDTSNQIAQAQLVQSQKAK